MNHNIILLVGVCFLLIVLGISIHRFQKLRKGNVGSFNPYEFELFPQLFPVIGILFTFIGVAYGFWDFDVDKVEDSIPALITGLKSAFIASAIGVLLLIVTSWLLTRYQNKYNYQKASDETLELRKNNALLQEMLLQLQANNSSGQISDLLPELQQINGRFQHLNVGINTLISNTQQTDLQAEIQQIITKIERLLAVVSDNLMDLRSEVMDKDDAAQVVILLSSLKEVSQANLRSMGEQGKTLREGFDTLLEKLDVQHYKDQLALLLKALNNSQHQSKEVAEEISSRLEIGFRGVKQAVGETTTELRTVGEKIAAPGTEMMERMLEEMKEAMQGLMTEMRGVFSDSLREQMVALSDSLAGSVDIIKLFPEQVGLMSVGLENALEKVNTEVTSFSSLMEQLQNQHSSIIERETDLSEKQEQALQQVHQILAQMTGFTNEASHAWQNLDDLKATLNQTATGLARSVTTIETSVNQMKQANEEAHNTTQLSIGQQQAILDSLDKAVNTVHKMPEDFVTQFRVINEGLQGIFEQIDKGLNSYQENVRQSINGYLDRFTGALSSANGALEENMQSLTDSHEELARTLGQFHTTVVNNRR